MISIDTDAAVRPSPDSGLHYVAAPPNVNLDREKTRSINIGRYRTHEFNLDTHHLDRHSTASRRTFRGGLVEVVRGGRE